MSLAKATTRSQVVSIIKAYSGKDAQIAIPRVLVELCGDYNRAAVLNQILFWSEITKDSDGWFYKSATDWELELGLSRYQVKRAVEGDKRSKDNSKALISLGVVTTVRKNPKGAPTTHYRIDNDIFEPRFMQAVRSYLSKLNNVKGGTSTSPEKETEQCSSSSYTESTTESTRAREEKIKQFPPQDDNPFSPPQNAKGESVGVIEPEEDEATKLFQAYRHKSGQTVSGGESIALAAQIAQYGESVVITAIERMMNTKGNVGTAYMSHTLPSIAAEHAKRQRIHERVPDAPQIDANDPLFLARVQLETIDKDIKRFQLDTDMQAILVEQRATILREHPELEGVA